MVNSPVLQSVKFALEAHAFQGKLYNKIGNNSNPRGIVTMAYRNAYRALKTAMNELNRQQAITEVLGQLKATVKNGVEPILVASLKYSQTYAEQQLSLYGQDVKQTSSIDLSIQVDNAIEAITTGLDEQATRITSILIAGLDNSLILGDENHIGLLRPSEIISAVDFWISSLLWLNFENTFLRSAGGADFDKVAVAALDERTTDCCIRVHGQVQPFDGTFCLEGSPRYADRMDWSPFHKYCRTSIAIKHHNLNDPVIDIMRTSARTILQERINGISRDKHPADVFYIKTNS